MTEPRTAAGRAMLEAVTVDPKSAEFGIAISLYSIVRHATPLIEAEARAAALDEARAAVDALPTPVDTDNAEMVGTIGRPEALAAIDELREDANKP